MHLQLNQCSNAEIAPPTFQTHTTVIKVDFVFEEITKQAIFDGEMKLTFPHTTCLQVGVIGHGLMLSLSIAKWRNLLNSQLLVYDGDIQEPQDLSNLLPEGTDSDPDTDTWLMHHESIPAFPHRNHSTSSNRRSFGSKRYF